jgi:pyruvate/2-oxoacid:ferredoxin oxidoreductase alpha subunit
MSLVTGNERNEWGQVSAEPGNRVTMMDKRSRKLETITPLLPKAASYGDASSKVGVIGVGIAAGIISETYKLLEKDGVNLRVHRPRVLYPMLQETLDFIASCDRVYVVEHSESGQLERVLNGAGADPSKLYGIRKYDGTPFWTDELAQRIKDAEAAQ